jgi:hypothetical protein
MNWGHALKAITSSACLTLLLIGSAASTASVTYEFDFAITSDMYRGSLNGPLFTRGTQGTGTVTFTYQPMSAATEINSVNATYGGNPFNVKIFFAGESIALIDSTVVDKCNALWCGIIVQDVPVTDVTYDTILFEGLSGTVDMNDAAGNPVSRRLYTRLGMFALSSTISDTALSKTNVLAISEALADTTLEIENADGDGVVTGLVSNIRMVSPPTAAPTLSP